MSNQISLSGETVIEVNELDIALGGKILIGGQVTNSAVLASNSLGELEYTTNDFDPRKISNTTESQMVFCNDSSISVTGDMDFNASNPIKIGGSVGTGNKILGVKSGVFGYYDNDFSSTSIENTTGTVKVLCDTTQLDLLGQINLISPYGFKLNNVAAGLNQFFGTNALGGMEWTDKANINYLEGTNINIDTGTRYISTINNPTFSTSTTTPIINVSGKINVGASPTFGTAGQILKVNSTETALEYSNETNTTYTGTGNITIDGSNQIGIINNPTFSTSIETPNLTLSGSNPQILIGGTAPINKVLGTDGDGNIVYKTETGTIYTASGNLSIDGSNDITINNQPNFTTSTTTPQLLLDGSNPKILLDGTFGTAGQALVIDSTGQKLEYVSGAISRTLIGGDNIDITIAGNDQTIALEDPATLGTLNAFTINNHSLQLINDPDTGDPPTLKLGADLGNGANFQYLRAGAGGVVNYQNPWTNNKKYANAFRAVRYISLSNVLELSTVDDDTIFVFGLNYGYYFSSSSPLQRDWRQEIPEHIYLSSGLGYPNWTPTGSGLTQTCGQTNWMYKSPTSGTNSKSCYAIFLPPPASDAVMTFNITINLPAGVNQLPTGSTYALNSEVQGRTIRVGFPNKEGRLLGTILNQNFSASCPLTLEIADDVTYFILDPFQESSNNDTFNFDCGCHMEFTYYGDTTYINCKVETFTESTITVPDRPTARDSFFGDGNATNGRKACRINSNMTYY